MLDENVIEMYSTHNKGKSIVAERNITSTIYSHMTVVSKNVYIDKLEQIVDKYTTVYHRRIKMMLPDATMTI